MSKVYTLHISKVSPEKPTCRTRKQQLEMDMGQPTGSKLGKEYVKAVIEQSSLLIEGCILSPCLFNVCEDYII